MNILSIFKVITIERKITAVNYFKTRHQLFCFSIKFNIHKASVKVVLFVYFRVYIIFDNIAIKSSELKLNFFFFRRCLFKYSIICLAIELRLGFSLLLKGLKFFRSGLKLNYVFLCIILTLFCENNLSQYENLKFLDNFLNK